MSQMNSTSPMGDYNYTFTPKGWECPKCGRVYSPSTAMCYYCGNQTITTSPTSQPICSCGTGIGRCPIHGGSQTPYGGTKLCDKHFRMYNVTEGCTQCRQENENASNP